MKRFFFLLVSFIFVNVLSAQSNIDTNITGDDAGWGDGYDLVYKVDGQIFKTITYEEGATIISEPEPTKEGYTFSGWSEIPSTMPAKNVEVTGTFIVNSYCLVYKVDGIVYYADTIAYGSSITAIQVPTKEGYTCSGWSRIPSKMPSHDVEVTGSFSINSYALTYELDGQVYDTDTLIYGSPITALSIPPKDGYTFSGWSEIPSTMPARDIEIIGTFSINSYKLVYKVDGKEYKTYTLEYGSTITAEPALTTEGYTFSGWSEIPATMPAKDVEVIGTLTINSYILTYILDGVEYKKDTLQYASTITSETDPEKEGYTFSGWRGLPNTMPAKDVTVTGSFGQNTYKLTYKVDGEIYRSFYIEYNATINTEPEPTKEGYIFSSWSEIPENMPAHNVEVTGNFSIGLFLLIYNVDDALYHVDTLIYNSEITPLPEPEIEGYTFSGWSKIPATMPGKNVEITGKFKVNSYKLVYYVDGEEYRTSTYTYGSPVTPKTAPSKRGYTFSGWSEIPETMPAHDVDVIGTFSINKYLLTYKVDGEIYHTDTLTYESAITALAEPVKEGYTFSGWSDIPATMPNKDVEISGKFKVNNYKLVYIVDGEEYRTYTQAYGSTITPKSELTKKGFTFSGWSEIPATMPAYDVTVTGTFSRNSYLLVYKVDGEVYYTDTIMYESAITALAEPTREGYTFSGWKDLPATMPYKDVEVTGKFKINSYNLTYILDGEVYKSYTIEYGDDITPERNPSKDGFTFSGWNGLPETMPANDVTVTGSFGEKTYKLVYKVDGVVYKTDTLAYGAAITAEPAPTKEGYTFSGWSTVPATMPAKDVEVTGKFSINSYTLTYKLDGTEYKIYTLTFGAAVTAEPEPSKEGYTFSGWSEIPSTMPAKDVEVTGKFSINSYILTYIVDGAEYKKDTVQYGAAITAEPAPTKEGSTFSGWSEIPATMPAKDVTVTGSFGLDSYKLIYKVDGTEFKTYTLNYGSTITAEPEPSKEGYTFSGWSEIPATMPAKDIEVTGKFSVNSYILTYIVDGVEYKKDTLQYGSTIALEPAPAKEGSTFSGWSEIPATMPANDVTITGSFGLDSYKLIYKVDGTEFKTYTLNYGSTITAEPEPSKEGYTFSGWSEIPATMPAKDIEVTGFFTVNRYLLTVIVDEEVVFSDSIAYGVRLAEYLDELTKQGVDFTKWELYDQIDTITMPAHDVTINAIDDAVDTILMDINESIIYDLTGKKIETDDISTLPSGIYILNGFKYIVY